MKYDLSLLTIYQKLTVIFWIIFNRKKFDKFNSYLLIGMHSRATYNKCKNDTK